MAIGEVFLGAFLTFLLEKLASADLLKCLHAESIEGQVKKWRRTLALIQAVLADAESKQGRNEAVKMWLDDLRDLAYDLDDVVDELATESLRRKLVDSGTSSGSTSEVLAFIPTSLSLSTLSFAHKMGSKLEAITSRLEDLANEISLLELVNDVMKPSPSRYEERRALTTPLVESHIYGRDKDTKAVIETLLSESGPESVPVLTIVGMGGVGKTTLVQQVYNDDKVRDFFELRVWACVSDDFDIIRISKTILRAVSSDNCENDDLSLLQVKLKDQFSKRKFLLILDDVWNENYEAWDTLRRPFIMGSPGSKLIITTRHRSVARLVMSSFEPYMLEVLTDIDGLSLLAQHSLGSASFDAYPDLLLIGKRLVTKCKNLPLALKAIGGMLRNITTSSEWQKILNSEIWDLDESKSDVLPALRLSFHHLPSHLKQCFAYCSLYPQDYEFEKQELILLWMAEGFLQNSKRQLSMEELGDEFFEELYSRSFFQQSNINKWRYVMHDLINDLARYMAGKICFRLETDMEKDCQEVQNARHASFIMLEHEDSCRFEVLCQVKNLRTFLALQHARGNPYYLSNKILVDILPQLVCLKVLKMSHYEIYDLPDFIGKLKQLRYLNLSGTWLLSLPESVSDLCNLQTLLLRNCKRLRKLPEEMSKLINLRHLDNAFTGLRKMPMGFAQLTNLKTLSKIVVSSSGGLKLRDLEKLSHLRGQMSIEHLEKVRNIGDARDACLMHKLINNLVLSWSDKSDDSRNQEFENDLLNSLQPNEGLEELKIKGYGGNKWPKWIEDAPLLKLRILELSYCKNCTSLPKLGQLPLLKELRIEGMHKVESIVGTETFGSTCPPSIEVLEFRDMPQWKAMWPCSTSMNSSTAAGEEAMEFLSLKEFAIYNCPSLVRIPILKLPLLSRLELSNCRVDIIRNCRKLDLLTTLVLKEVRGLSSLSEALVDFPPKAIETLLIYNCNSLLNLWPNVGSSAMPNLQDLYIRGCKILESLPSQRITMPGLKDLHIERCSSMRLGSTDMFSPCLSRISISGCRQLDSPSLDKAIEASSLSLLELEWGSLEFRNLPGFTFTTMLYNNLSALVIDECHGLESFPQGGLPTPNLGYIRIERCKNLKSLPLRLENLVFLRRVSLRNLPGLMEAFPPSPDYLPSSLRTIDVQLVNMKPLSVWGLRKLTSLQTLEFGKGYPDLTVFGDEESLSAAAEETEGQCVLPSTLTWLSICKLPNLELLSSGLKGLSTLQHLFFADCPKLQSLAPLEDRLERLSSFCIYRCPILKKRCERGTGNYWPSIANIPKLKIDKIP